MISSDIDVSKFESVATKELNWRGMVIFLSETIESRHRASNFLFLTRNEYIIGTLPRPHTHTPPLGFQVPRCRFLLFVFTATSNSASYLPRACNSSRFTPRRFRAFSMRENMTRAFPMRSAHKDNKHVGAPCLLFLKSSKRKS